jgi:hypothetical protein
MKTTKITYGATKPIENVIFTVRGEKVILDRDLAATYGVETKELNRAVKRNADRFPADFAFQLTRQEVTNLKCQIGTSSLQHGGRRKPTWAFTEQGAIMAANVSRSPWAMKMSVFVVRAFVKLRRELGLSREFATRLAELERKLTDRLNLHEKAILHLLRQMQDLLNPPAGPEPPKKEIGFHVKEGKARYVVHRKKTGSSLKLPSGKKQ